jgi:hypothetical protein
MTIFIFAVIAYIVQLILWVIFWSENLFFTEKEKLLSLIPGYMYFQALFLED